MNALRGRWFLAISLLLAAPRSLVGCSSTAQSGPPGASTGSPSGGVDAATEGSAGAGSGVAGGNSLGRGGGSNGGDISECTGPCCVHPAAGSPCTSEDEGATCSGDNVCAGGIDLPFSIECTSGTWVASGEPCPPDGGVTEAGCPGSPPSPGTPCSIPADTSCPYTVKCACQAPPPLQCNDAGACSGVIACAEEAASVSCSNGSWNGSPFCKTN